MEQLSFDDLEAWKSIPGWEGYYYEASTLGRIRRTRGRNGHGWYARVTIRKPAIGKQGYYLVGLWRDGVPETKMVHRLVARTFLGPRPEGLEIRHLNDNKLDNRLVNLVYGTRSENKQDEVRNGRNHHARKTHCPQGHEYTPENTYYAPSNPRNRLCRICKGWNGIKPGAFNRNKTHCKRGHEFNEVNTYTKRDGGRDCRVCRREGRPKAA